MTANDEFLAYLLRRLDLAGMADVSTLELMSHSTAFPALKLTAGDTPDNLADVFDGELGGAINMLFSGENCTMGV